jgi:acyl-CoA reductase-like NAD-dependent aldehyde dehydrogenase
MTSDWHKRSKSLMPRVRNWIDGRSCDTNGSVIEKRAPRDGRSIYQFGSGTSADVDAAVAAARRTFGSGVWSTWRVGHRMAVLQRLADLIEKHSQEFALLECMDVGKPIRDARAFDLPAAISTIRYDVEAADKWHGDVYATDSSSLSYQLHRPLGVVGAIVGWNFPLVLAVGKVAPALATGNCLILKPSELTPLSACKLAELSAEAGLPPGVLNVINGDGAVGAALARHGDVDLVTFTGSTRTGKQLLIASGQSNMKRIVLECGGKAPNIVFDDCPDLDAVAESIVARAFWNQGQVCTASSRLLIQDTVREDLISRVIHKASRLIPGDPLDAETGFGAVVSAGHREKLLSYVDAGKSAGARVAFASSIEAPVPGGYYVAPVIFDDVVPGMRIAQEEIFGPVLSIMSFSDEREAIKIANDTIYGLSAILWTRDLGRAHRVTYGVRAGWIVVNATHSPSGGPTARALSIGGHRESGIGAEGGIEGLETYTAKTAVQMFI